MDGEPIVTPFQLQYGSLGPATGATVAPLADQLADVSLHGGEPAVSGDTVVLSAAQYRDLLKSREVLRAKAKQLQAMNREQFERFSAEREELQERILSLEYDTNEVSLREQFTELDAKYKRSVKKLQEWERWKGRAEDVTQDLAKRLREEQKIRKALEKYIAKESGMDPASGKAAAAAVKHARQHSFDSSAGSSTLSSGGGGGGRSATASPRPLSPSPSASSLVSPPLTPAQAPLSISVHHL